MVNSQIGQGRHAFRRYARKPRRGALAEVKLAEVKTERALAHIRARMQAGLNPPWCVPSMGLQGRSSDGVRVLKEKRNAPSKAGCRGKPPKSLVSWSSFAQVHIGRPPKMSVLSFSAVDSKRGGPYNPPIAEAAARKRGDDRSKPLREKRNFRSQVFRFRPRPKVENRVLTG